MEFTQQFSTAGPAAAPNTTTRIASPGARNLLPAGRVEAVQTINAQGAGPWRFFFDLEAFSEGRRLPDSRWKPRVLHVLHVLGQIARELNEAGVRCVYAAKGHDDRISVGIWKDPQKPLVVYEVAGWRVEQVALDWGREWTEVDTSLAEITDPRAFAQAGDR